MENNGQTDCPRPKVNIAVCGRFHFHNYVRFIDQAGMLNAFYYSHKISTDAANLGIPTTQAVNRWLKEYLIYAHGIFTHGWLVPECAPFYTDLWQAGALRQWRKCDVLHLMLHGAGVKMIRRAKSEGASVMVEAVNQHPHGLNDILRDEAERLGLRFRRTLHRIQKRQLEELELADFVLAPSKIVRESFVKRGFEKSRTAVIPFGVDLARFHPVPDRGAAEKTFRVICVAQISLRKGQIYLLEAWRKLKFRNAELLLIGSISHEMAERLEDYKGMFRHIPSVPNHKLFEYYGRSSVFVLPTLEDGCSYVCGEAMACGLPVITTVNNGASDIVNHGANGFVIPIRSPESVAEHLETLYRDEALRSQMASAALMTARTELSWERYAARLCEIYSMLSEGRPACNVM
jgi:glycosyltransferase involved in cell wall biosynthesis